MSTQLDIADGLTEAFEARDRGLDRSYYSTADESVLAFDRVLAAFIAAASPFSFDDLRCALDLAGVPAVKRGALQRSALRRQLIWQVNVVKSSNRATHGKRIGVYLPGPGARGLLAALANERTTP